MMKTRSSFNHAKALLIKEIGRLDFDHKPPIYRIQIPFEPVDEIAWLAAQQSLVKVYGANQDNSACIAGIGCVNHVFGKHLTSYQRVFHRLRKSLSPEYPHLQWYGGFAFEKKPTASEWDSFGAYHFIQPLFEVARDGKKTILACNLIGALSQKEVLQQANGLNAPRSMNTKEPLKVMKRWDSPNTMDWEKSVKKVLLGIADDNILKVVLARKTRLLFQDTLNPWLVLARLKNVTPLSYHFAFQFGQTVFLGASPERLYQREGSKILSQALAGTASRECSAASLMTSPKDLHEHRIVVEAIKNALLQVAENLHYKKHPQVITLPNGHHLNTLFKARLNAGVNDEDILRLLHPTPALGGTPRDKALQYIASSEAFQRGWYGGPVGYVGVNTAEFVVAIRSGLIKDKTLDLYAGAGIVDGSKPKTEWDEIDHKISNFQRIVTQ